MAGDVAAFAEQHGGAVTLRIAPLSRVRGRKVTCGRSGASLAYAEVVPRGAIGVAADG